MYEQAALPRRSQIEVVKQITERGHSAADVAKRIGVSGHSLYSWVKHYGDNSAAYAQTSNQQEELRWLKAELKRVTEERDILKKARSLPRHPGKVRIYRSQ